MFGSFRIEHRASIPPTCRQPAVQAGRPGLVDIPVWDDAEQVPTDGIRFIRCRSDSVNRNPVPKIRRFTVIDARAARSHPEPVCVHYVESRSVHR